MKTVKFVKSVPNPRPGSPHKEFEAGRQYMLPDDSAGHWTRRGIATYITPEVPARINLSGVKPAEITSKPVDSPPQEEKQEAPSGDSVASTAAVEKQDGGDTGNRPESHAPNRGGRPPNSRNSRQ